ncbi:hypothetical protein GL4_1213 [Methyloceanibacter caenitepidi]|uniref:Uncharacterized protein n=1 Tax=Methyloceanibacter caenitepidi TaxID=1384459 RepID=A0A0A8K1I4_9HYPH|nr:hypothetical protein GL4_1213 [Methyloceanibacter caenitepidi]
MFSRQLPSARHHDRIAGEAFAACGSQHVHHREARADQDQRLRLGEAIGRNIAKRRKRPVSMFGREAIGRREDHHVGPDRLGVISANDKGGSFATARQGRSGEHIELSIRPAVDSLHEPLPDVLSEQLAGKECVAQSFQESWIVFALVQVPKGPMQKVAGLVGIRRKVASPDIEQVERMVTTIGDATP